MAASSAASKEGLYNQSENKAAFHHIFDNESKKLSVKDLAPASAAPFIFLTRKPIILVL